MRRLFDGRPVVTKRSPFANEERYLTTGIVSDRFVTVVWTRRDDAIRLISARRARDGEVRAYRALHGGRD
ncbi:MAG: BrnT family toxin [Thermomicrobiales bacterium]